MLVFRHQVMSTLLRLIWNHPGKTAVVCYHALLQGISPPRDQNRVSASTPQEILHCWDNRYAMETLHYSKHRSLYWLIDRLPGGSMEKNVPSMWETWVQFLVWEDSLKEGMATHSSVLPWRIPMDRGAWQATVYGVTKGQTRLSD